MNASLKNHVSGYWSCLKTWGVMLCLLAVMDGSVQATVVISNNFQNQVGPFGPGTTPQLFGTVAASNLPVNKPTIIYKDAVAGTPNYTGDVYIVTSGLGFATQHAEVSVPTNMGGGFIAGGRVSWDISPLAITSGAWQVNWDASAAQVSLGGGRFNVKRPDGLPLFEMAYWGAGFYVWSSGTAFGSYQSNTPSSFALNLSLDTGTFNLAMNGTNYVTNGTLKNWTNGTAVSYLDFGSTAGSTDSPGTIFGIDNLLLVSIPEPTSVILITVGGLAVVWWQRRRSGRS